jgi:uncharacterized protein (TIGR00297 family)
VLIAALAFPTNPITRAGLAAGAATAIALTARRAGSLSTSGAVAAIITGTVAMTAGAAWGSFLVVWFVAASLLSRLGRTAKAARTGQVIEKGGARDAAQVLANGGVFASAAAVALLRPDWAELAAGAAAGALTAAGADTAATEIGTLWGGTPWSLRTQGPAPAGTSGAISVAGTMGMAFSAALLGALAAVLQLIPWSAAGFVAYAGVCGALADTVIGAWWQARRWCPTCDRGTEQPVHTCGTATRAAGGLPWLTNDRVNLLCTIVGAVVALALARP